MNLLTHALYALSSLAKVAPLKAVDAINKLADPFEEFDRPVNPKHAQTLEEKASLFEDHFLAKFYQPPMSMFVHSRDLGDLHHVKDTGDQCLWQGVYTAMWAIKYSVTELAADGARVLEGLAGMQLHQPQGRLIRGIDNNRVVTDDVSNDSASGHLMGLYWAWKYGPDEATPLIAKLIASLAAEIVNHDFCLIGADGKPTTYGRLINGHKTEPLSLTLCLAILRFAYEVTRHEPYLQHYKDLVKKFKPLLAYAHFKALWLGQSSQALRASIHYSVLCDLEKSQSTLKHYVEGMKRTWEMERKSGNPFVYYMLRRVLTHSQESLESVTKHLHEMTVEDKAYNGEKLNSHEVETFRWGKKILAKQPVPRWKAGSQDFFWQRNLYVADDWVGKVPDVEHNGGDYLIAYWGLKQLRLI